MNLTKGAMYFYFKDKEELFKAVVRSVIQPALQQVLKAAQKCEGPTEELLRLFLRTFYREIAHDRKRSVMLNACFPFRSQSG